MDNLLQERGKQGLTQQMQDVLLKCTTELESYMNRISLQESEPKTFLKTMSEAQTSFTQVD